MVMEKIEVNESNLFSTSIIELKLITDRIAEGIGEDAGIFTNMHQILYILSRNDVVTPREIISEMNIAKSNLAILAKKMILDGLIESHKDKVNKREIYYNITNKGREVLKGKMDLIDAYYGSNSKSLLKSLSRSISWLRKLENKDAQRKIRTNTR